MMTMSVATGSSFSGWPPESKPVLEVLKGNAMCQIVKWVIVLALAVLLVYAGCDGDCRAVTCEKIWEGMAGGLMAALVLTFSKLEALQRRELFTFRRVLRLVRRDVCAGLVGGLLLGLLFAGILLFLG
jgi:hypothetical protein